MALVPLCFETWKHYFGAAELSQKSLADSGKVLEFSDKSRKSIMTLDIDIASWSPKMLKHA